MEQFGRRRESQIHRLLPKGFHGSILLTLDLGFGPGEDGFALLPGLPLDFLLKAASGIPSLSQDLLRLPASIGQLLLVLLQELLGLGLPGSGLFQGVVDALFPGVYRSQDGAEGEAPEDGQDASGR